MVFGASNISGTQNYIVRLKIARSRPLSKTYLNKLRGLISARWEKTWNVVKDRAPEDVQDHE